MKNNLKNEHILFSTLWAIVIKKLDKMNDIAPCSSLERIIEEACIKHVYPYKPLPNVKDFQITNLAPYDPILQEHGIIKRLRDADKE
jgi:hypothetical protein